MRPPPVAPARCETATRAATRTLRHGAPARGLDPLGAKTRTGCPCRSPAMKNGRCPAGQARGKAPHGGGSTGPRTAAGLARLRAARTRHGFYGAESQAALRREDEFIAETRALLALVRAGAQPADPVGAPAVRLAGAAAPRLQKVRRSGRTHTT